MILDVDNLTKTYHGRNGDFTAVSGMSFSVLEGEFFTIVGPSGAGKTTLLRCLAGLMAASSGSITLSGQPVTSPPPSLAVVFQDYARSLLPWFTVAKNVELPLIGKVSDSDRRKRLVEDALRDVGLAQAGHKHPWQLSGGMQQRVAIARALAYQPQVLIMDEPFASVDAQTRAELEDLLLRIREESDVTIIFVTHDVDEAIYLSDRVAIVTRSPSQIAEIVDVALPRPRDQVTTKELPAFGHFRGHVFGQIRAMVNADRTAQIPA